MQPIDGNTALRTLDQTQIQHSATDTYWSSMNILKIQKAFLETHFFQIHLLFCHILFKNRRYSSSQDFQGWPHWVLRLYNTLFFPISSLIEMQCLTPDEYILYSINSIPTLYFISTKYTFECYFQHLSPNKQASSSTES